MPRKKFHREQLDAFYRFLEADLKESNYERLLMDMIDIHAPLRMPHEFSPRPLLTDAREMQREFRTDLRRWTQPGLHFTGPLPWREYARHQFQSALMCLLSDRWAVHAKEKSACAVCGTYFMPLRLHQPTCTPKCRAKLNRKTKARQKAERA
jgi:predicted nucleic acid-binding Zn ribbon protein